MNHLRATIERVLEAHGVEPGEALVAQLVAVAQTEAWWDDEQIVGYVGTIDYPSVRAWCSRYKVSRFVLSRADDVVAAKLGQRGQGWRKGLS